MFSPAPQNRSIKNPILIVFTIFLVFVSMSKATPVKTIVGGSEAERGSWPFIVALVSAGEDNLYDAQFCGGALISPWWVITASHCLPGENPSTVDIILGAHDLRSDSPGDYRRIKVSEIYLHPAFETGLVPGIDADVALIRLMEPVLDVEPISLVHDLSFTQPGTLTRVAGWGRVTDGGEASSILREVELPIVSLETANATGAYDQELTQDLLMAGIKVGGKDSCEGDSGGPLIVRLGDSNKWGLAGVVSFGSGLGCAAPNAYGAYARVSYFHHELLKWMNPEYSRWSQSFNVSGFFNDDDGDLKTTFYEFAFGQNPNLKESESPIRLNVIQGMNGEKLSQLSYKKVRGSDAVNYILSRSEDLVNWTDLTNMDFEPSENEGWVQAKELKSISEKQTSYYRLLAKPAVTESLPNYFAGTIRFQGRLDQPREFNMGHFEADGEVAIQFIAHNNSSQPKLVITESETKQQIATIMESENGEIRYSFTPKDGSEYLFSLSTTSGGDNGTFSFNVPPIESADTGGDGEYPMITPGQSIDDELTDEDVLFEGFFEDNFLISGVDPGQRIRITMSTSDQNPNFKPFLIIYNEQTFEEISSTEGQDSSEVSLTLTIQNGQSYLIGASNFEEGEKGKYSLKIDSLSNRL